MKKVLLRFDGWKIIQIDEKFQIVSRENETTLFNHETEAKDFLWKEILNDKGVPDPREDNLTSQNREVVKIENNN